MKNIFLDVDGVMNSHRRWKWIKENGRPTVPESVHHIYSSRCADGSLAISSYFDPEAIEALNFIVAESGARIVISSTWRDWNLFHLHEHFRWQGYTGPRFYSRTPGGGGRNCRSWNRRHKRIEGQAGALYISETRGQQIAWWLAHIGRNRVRSYIVLDDEAVDGHADRFIQTDYETGLTMRHARRAVAMLNKPQG